MAKDEFGGTQNQEILFDLRQTYAIKILTPILLALEIYKETNNFIDWYDKLTVSLYTNVNQKLTAEEREEYKTKNEKCLEIINKNKDSYCGRDKDAKRVHEVKTALLELEMWIKEKMEDHGLFGKAGEYDWDEI